jgi:hypothetical protein
LPHLKRVAQMSCEDLSDSVPSDLLEHSCPHHDGRVARINGLRGMWPGKIIEVAGHCSPDLHRRSTAIH